MGMDDDDDGEGRKDVDAASDEPAARLRFTPPTLYPIDHDANGRVFPSRVAGYDVTVLVPQSDTHRLEPGTGAQWIVPRSLELTVPTAAVPDLAGSDATTLRWWQQITEWLGAWRGVAAEVDVPLERRVQPIADPATQPTTDGGAMRFYGFNSEMSATTSEFAEALRLAGKNAEMPAEYRLLVNAQVAKRDRNMRVCVIEACAAAEVAAAAAIERSLKETYRCPEAFIQACLRRARGLTLATAMCVDLGLPTALDKATVDGLAKMRNTAVHAGRPMHATSADEALATVRRMVLALSGRAVAPLSAQGESSAGEPVARPT